MINAILGWLIIAGLAALAMIACCELSRGAEASACAPSLAQARQAHKSAHIRWHHGCYHAGLAPTIPRHVVARGVPAPRPRPANMPAVPAMTAAPAPFAPPSPEDVDVVVPLRVRTLEVRGDDFRARFEASRVIAVHEDLAVSLARRAAIMRLTAAFAERTP